jgi:hypothetical protein
MGISSAKLSKMMQSWDDPKKKTKRKAGADLAQLFEAGRAHDASGSSSSSSGGGGSGTASTAPVKKQDELAALASEDDFDFVTKSEVCRLWAWPRRDRRTDAS